MERARYLGRGSVDMVPDLIDLACHLTQHVGVLVLEAQLQGFEAGIHGDSDDRTPGKHKTASRTCLIARTSGTTPRLAAQT